MPLPSLQKTWQFNVNQAIAAKATSVLQLQALLFAIKQSFVGFAQSPWTVKRSSDGVGASNSDLWVSSANLVTGNLLTSPRAWIVLKQSALAPSGGTGFELLIDLQSQNGDSAIGLIASPNAGFTGGTTTSRPTATDEMYLQTPGSDTPAIGYNAAYGGATLTSYRLHAMQSTDGQCTRMFLYRTSGTPVCCAILMFDKLANPTPNIDLPYYACWYGSNASNVASMTNYVRSGNGLQMLNLRINGTPSRATMCAECTGSTILATTQTFANELSSEWPLWPIGAVSEATDGSPTDLRQGVGVLGRLGNLFDVWFGSTGVSTLDTYPADASQQFAQFGQLVVPWNGTTPLAA